MKVSDWIIIDEYCATRTIEGKDPNLVENRVAFIEKSPRVRIASFSPVDDYKNWEFGRGSSEYGFDTNSREWCDKRLVELGYSFI
jgi:hypothetical protein